ncbi:PREDICTED: uncharacterized protein LOC105460813 [Wasmannia auropunctata]|uniref:uncharacterized protein LOC105460813 n=1 Tax=Wasmannia auropunctata TaxID=64793 RepID=UPI0005EF0F8D|nr:PREDICTED: uncharacterized protein LOC105460813 [Wasmannia auropunctata]
MFFLLIVVGVICGGLNSFRIFQMVAFECNAMELLLPIIFVSIHFTYTFVGNYAAQQITDHNSDIFATVYNIQWYTAPLQIQKIILFLLQRSNKAFTLKYIGGLFVGSLEGAATVKYLMEQLQQICNELKNENEINIMKEYGNYVKRYTVALICKIIYVNI